MGIERISLAHQGSKNEFSHTLVVSTAGYPARPQWLQSTRAGIRDIVTHPKMRQWFPHFLFVAIHHVLPEVSLTPPTRSPQVISAGSLIALAPRLTARL